MEDFKIAVGDGAIADLRRRLVATRWPKQVAAGWDEGTDLEYLRALVEEWCDRFDWRAREEELNRQPQVLVELAGQTVHAVHRRGVGPAPMPLVLTHGWPSTFAEWHRVIDALADPAAHGGAAADAFHVVAPSLPGYGFSSAPATPGMTPRRIAELWVALMKELGYERFGAHGCDWGAYVTALLGLDHPGNVLGIHMGMVSLAGPADRASQSAEEAAYVERARRWRDQEHGYVAIQSTKPATLAYGLNDSPAGLAAWIAEKWRAWSDCGGDPETAISSTDLLTTIALYWFTDTIGTASRLYLESRKHPVHLAGGQRVSVPAGFLLEAPGDASGKSSFLDVPRIGAPPQARAARAFDIHRWTVVERGGHFPALEIPDQFVDEVRAFFRPLRGS